MNILEGNKKVIFSELEKIQNKKNIIDHEEVTYSLYGKYAIPSHFRDLNPAMVNECNLFIRRVYSKCKRVSTNITEAYCSSDDFLCMVWELVYSLSPYQLKLIRKVIRHDNIMDLLRHISILVYKKVKKEYREHCMLYSLSQKANECYLKRNGLIVKNVTQE